MNRSIHISGVILLFLVILMSASAIYLKGSSELIKIILGLSAIKFLLVAFQFMDMKKSNAFWKVILILFVGIVFSSFLLLL